jgi:citrate synthase
VLAYCGHDIHDLARNATFEETCYLLWHGRLPNRAELGDLQSQLAAARPLPEPILRLMKMLPPSDGMDALRTLTSALGHYDPDAHDNSLQASYRKAVRLTGRSPASSPRGAACRRAADRSRRIRRWDTPPTSSTCCSAAVRIRPRSARWTSR